VVNQVDQTRQLTKDVLKVLRNMLGGKMFSGVIHLDEGVSESLAYATPRANFAGTGYVVNQVDQTRQLTKDVLKVLRNMLGGKMFSGVIHLDEGVSESLACDTTLIHYDPLSQAAADLRACGEWLLNSVDAMPVSPRNVA
ncbi:cellulose synthase operon protein YhjQ/BcsQ, partial [Caballeronia sp. M23-90]